jgi:NTP pyrophosphatase (non-canonical NTP hydrolase)
MTQHNNQQAQDNKQQEPQEPMKPTTDPKEYRNFVRSLCKAGSIIAAELTPDDAHKLHMAIGASGEAGELLDAIKKACIYRKPLDVANVREECGDILFYVTGLLDSIGCNLDEVISENMAKLSTRYQSMAFSNAAAIARVDKQPQGQDKDHGSEVKAPAPEDDFEDVKIERTCNLDDETCESCQ